MEEAFPEKRVDVQNGIKNENHLIQLVVSGIPGAIITSLISNPFDVIKLRMQIQNIREVKSGRSLDSLAATNSLSCNRYAVKYLFGRTNLWHSVLISGCCNFRPKSDFGRIGLKAGSSSESYILGARNISGLIDGFTKISGQEGVNSLFRGLSSTIVTMIPSNSIYIPLYQYTRNKLSSKFGDYKGSFVIIPAASGMSARVFTTAVTCPLELIRTRLQSGVSASSKSIFNEMAEVSKLSRVFSLWRGLSATLCRDIPFSGIYWMSYEFVRYTLISAFNNPVEKSLALDMSINFSAGAISGTLAALVTMPQDVIKTHIQTMPVKENQGSVIAAVKHIMKKKGARALFSGISPRLARIVPACAASISSYETMKYLLTAT